MLSRRQWLAGVATAAVLPAGRLPGASRSFVRVRPGDAAWPSAADWAALGRRTGGNLIKLDAPFAPCETSVAACNDLFGHLRNPYRLGDDPAFTQTIGWVDAWVSRPSVYAVAARSVADVAAAVDFARERRLRLVVKGGGHSYQGTSNAADSLLIWTRHMDRIELHDGFIAAGSRGAPQPAVSVGAGCLWGRVYHAVSQAGRYVPGGGCLTVGVAGLVQSGGFGSLSKAFGSAAAGLIEAEILTADGRTRIVNAWQDPELFWALKGGGGGSFGVVTRLTLRTHPLPASVGVVQMEVRSASDAAHRALIARLLAFYRADLMTPHWGEQILLRHGNRLGVFMVAQGLAAAEIGSAWKPFLDWLAARPQEYAVSDKTVLAFPARDFWDPAFLRKGPGVVIGDDRPGAPAENVFWAANQGEAGQVLHAYRSAWLPAALLAPGVIDGLAGALFAASRHWQVSLHVNKGLAGAPPDAIAATRDTATNPQACDAFALLICAAEGPPAYPGVPGHAPDIAEARAQAAAIGRAMDEVYRVAPHAGSYVSEGDYFEKAWQTRFWGSHYPRLLAAKRRYDPDGLFFVHHGVGSEGWSRDGFTRLS